MRFGICYFYADEQKIIEELSYANMKYITNPKKIFRFYKRKNVQQKLGETLLYNYLTI